MRMKIPDGVRILRWIAIPVLLTLSAASCATVPKTPGPELRVAPLPSYKKGTTFIYSDGTWETVIAASPEAITWSNHRNNVASGPADFTYRRTEWETPNRRGTRQFGPRQDLIANSDTSLWPLRTGNALSYSETGSYMDKDGTETSYQTEWSCDVAGTERVAVMAGEFDTWKIVCKRYYVSKSKSKSHIREMKTWYYAPEVGHYVLTTSKYYYPKEPRQQELLAVLPPRDDLSAEARRQMDRSFQQALEFKKSGESHRWSNSTSGISGETIITHTFKTPDGTYCRRYVQKLNLPDGQRTYHGIAVRDANGVWIVPRR